jgi:hypothetical protein
MRARGEGVEERLVHRGAHDQRARDERDAEADGE